MYERVCTWTLVHLNTSMKLAYCMTDDMISLPHVQHLILHWHQQSTLQPPTWKVILLYNGLEHTLQDLPFQYDLLH